MSERNETCRCEFGPRGRRERGHVQLGQIANGRKKSDETPGGETARERREKMGDLTQTISNIVGILLGLVGAVGVGFFIYGAYLYLTASGAPHQMERGKSAMMTALAGIVLAMVGYGVVELVMNAVVNPAVEIDSIPTPATPTPESSSG